MEVLSILRGETLMPNLNPYLEKALDEECAYISSLGICNICNNGNYDDDWCSAYKMPLQVIGGRKKKCKRFDDTLQPIIGEYYGGW